LLDLSPLMSDMNDPANDKKLRILQGAPTPETAHGVGHHDHDEEEGDLTEREQSVLAELMEGHCAEEIAKAAFVSISTVRSQIKAILQKLGVNSQLAAVALTRRAGWSSKDSVARRGERASARRVQPTRRPL